MEKNDIEKNDLECCEEFCVNDKNIETVREKMLSDAEAMTLADIFKVLADPTRIKIINILYECEMCVCDIAQALDMTQSAISHQLRILRGCRLVRNRKQGKMVIYSLDDEHILKLYRHGLEHIRHN